MLWWESRSGTNLLWILDNNYVWTLCRPNWALPRHVRLVCKPSILVVWSKFVRWLQSLIEVYQQYAWYGIQNLKQNYWLSYLLRCKSFSCCLLRSNWSVTFELFKYPSKCQNIGHTHWLFRKEFHRECSLMRCNSPNLKINVDCSWLNGEYLLKWRVGGSFLSICKEVVINRKISNAINFHQFYLW